jgi:RNA polymerase sigma factor (sigma-70 family)
MIDFHEIRLTSRLRAGRPDAYAEVYDTYATRLMAYARQLCANRDEAEDLVQETLLAAWQGRDSFRGEMKLLSWLLGIMSRRCRDNCRRTRVATVSLADEGARGEPAAGIDPGSRLESGVINRLTMDDALASLDLPFREAPLLIHSQGFTYREAAEVLAEPIGTVKWRVSVALSRVRLRLASCEEETNEVRQAAASPAG